LPFSVFKRIAEERIREAMEMGLFDELEYKGKPIEIKEDPFVPEELRIAYRMLKNAGFVPKEVELRKEIERLEELMDEDHQEAYSKIRKLSALLFHLQQIRDRPLQVEEQEYYVKIVERVKVNRYKREGGAQEEPRKINFSRLQTLLSIRSLVIRGRR